MNARAMGRVLFSIMSAVCTLATYAVYLITVWRSAVSWGQAVVQVFLLLLPDGVDVLSRAQRLYADITAE